MKKVLLTVLSAALIIILAAGGTVAYLSDTDSDVNVMTMGNVDIAQHEYERAKNPDGTWATKEIGGVTSYVLTEFTQAKPLMPATAVDANGNPYNFGAGDYDTTRVKMSQVGSHGSMDVFVNKNAQDKFVVVENTGRTDAYVRTIFAFEIGSLPENEFDNVISTSSFMTAQGVWEVTDIGVVEIDGNNYYVSEYLYSGAKALGGVHENGVLPAGDTAYPSLAQVYMKGTATNEDCEALDGNKNGTYDILVFSQAVQVSGFDTAETALDIAFGKSTEKAAEWFGGVKSKDFVPANAVKIESTITHDEFAALLEAGKNIYLTESVTIANPESSRFTEFVVDGEVGIWAAEGATLTFSETTGISGSGVLTVYSGAIDEKQELWVGATLVFEGGEHSFAALSVSGNGKIVVNGGTLNCKGTYAGIMGITFGENGSLVVNGGKINLYQPINLNPNRCDAAYVEFNGGTVELLNGIENLFVVRNVMDKDQAAGGVLRGSSIRVTGGTFIAHYEIDYAGDATSFIRNGDSPADGNKVLVSNADSYDCVVTGGTFYGSWQRADNTRYTDGNGGYADGNMVDNSIAGFVADGYKITGDATNGYVVSAN